VFANIKKSIEDQRIDTIIGPNSNIEGKINASGTIRIDGKYTGDIFSDGNVIVGENAVINGNIHAVNVAISGKVEGNIYSKGTLEILSTGRLDGDIEVSKISISDGAAFKGKCDMIFNNPVQE
jgi:cytoskeletal protein CcmA (bactofilin family)